MKEYDKIAKLVINLTETEIFENRKTQSHVDARTFFDYIMRYMHNKTLHSISSFYISKGKTSHHATIYHRLTKFEELLNRRPEFITWLNIIKNTIVDSKEALTMYDKIKGLKTRDSLDQVNELLDKLTYKEKLYKTLLIKS